MWILTLCAPRSHELRWEVGWVRSRLPFDTLEFLFLATDLAAVERQAAMVAYLSSWLVSSATAAALPQPLPSVQPTTLALSPS